MSGPSVQIPTSWLQDDDLEDLGGDTVMLMLTALAYCADQLDDGWVARRRLRKLWPVEDLEDSIARLTKAGEVDDQGERVLFVNWRDFILPAEEVDEIRASSRERSQRSRRHKRGDHTMCRPSYCDAARNAQQSRDGDVSVRVSDGLPIRTDPTRTDPTPREGRTGREKASQQGGSAGAPPPNWPPIGQGLVPPHDHALPPGVDEDDLEPEVHIATPCHHCGAPPNHIVHWSHKFVPDADAGPDTCGECYALFSSFEHTSYDDYLQAEAEGMWWPPQ